MYVIATSPNCECLRLDLYKTSDGRMTGLLELPGVAPKTIRLHRHRAGQLVVSGRRLSYVRLPTPPSPRAASPESEEDAVKQGKDITQASLSYAQEIRYGPFMRVLPIPPNVLVSSH
jgi:HSP20 family molecular chaperone IbpA